MSFSLKSSRFIVSVFPEKLTLITDLEYVLKGSFSALI
jgi:hypothetical protein